MRKNPEKRLGSSEKDAEDVKKQAFFRVRVSCLPAVKMHVFLDTSCQMSAGAFMNLSVSLYYFQHINWEDLLMRRVRPPFVPTVVSMGVADEALFSADLLGSKHIIQPLCEQLHCSYVKWTCSQSKRLMLWRSRNIQKTSATLMRSLQRNDPSWPRQRIGDLCIMKSRSFSAISHTWLTGANSWGVICGWYTCQMAALWHTDIVPPGGWFWESPELFQSLCHEDWTYRCSGSCDAFWISIVMLFTTMMSVTHRRSRKAVVKFCSLCKKMNNPSKLHADGGFLVQLQDTACISNRTPMYENNAVC